MCHNKSIIKTRRVERGHECPRWGARTLMTRLRGTEIVLGLFPLPRRWQLGVSPLSEGVHALVIETLSFVHFALNVIPMLTDFSIHF